MPLRRRHRPARNGPQPAARHLAVEVLVDVVVPGAGGAAQDDAAEEEEQAEAGEVAGRRRRAGEVGGVGEPDEVGDVEGVETGGAVEAHQFGVGDPGLGQEGEDAVVRGCVDGHRVRHGFFLDRGEAAFLGLGSHFFWERGMGLVVGGFFFGMGEG